MTSERARARVLPRVLAVGFAFALTPSAGCSGSGDSSDYYTSGGRSGSGGRGDPLGGEGNLGGEPSGGGSGGRSSSGGGGGSGGGFTPEPLTCETLVCQAGTCREREDGARCDCPSGFDGIDCTDTNECGDPLYCGGFPCHNGFGAVACSCDTMTVSGGSPRDCVDLDECELSPCHEDAECDNMSPGYACSCKSGFFGTGWDCVDTDPCAGDPCGEGTCIATSEGAVCQCPLGTGGPDCSVNCDSLPIADPRLQAAVFAATRLYPDSIVPARDLVGITTLDVSDRLIQSLDGLECWPTLERLDARLLRLDAGSDGTPLEALKSLTKLRQLDLSCSSGLDLSVLEGHPNLSLFRLNQGNCIDDDADLSVQGLSALGTLPRLESLNLAYVSLGSAAELGGLRALRSLILEDTDLDSTDGLESLRLLSDLSLTNNDITDASGLAALTNLRNLGLGGNSLPNIDFVTSLRELEVLDVNDTGIESLPDLSKLSRLRWLRARGNELRDLTPLLKAPSLILSDLSSNRIDSLEPLRGQNLRGDLTLDDNAPLEEDCDETLKIEAELRVSGLRVVSTCDVPAEE